MVEIKLNEVVRRGHDLVHALNVNSLYIYYTEVTDVALELDGMLSAMRAEHPAASDAIAKAQGTIDYVLINLEVLEATTIADKLSNVIALLISL